MGGHALREGIVEVSGETLVSPTRRLRCVFYSVELLDAENDTVVAAERDAMPFHLVLADGRQVALDPRKAELTGFGRVDVRSRPGYTNPEVLALARAKGVRDPEKRDLRLVERAIVLGDRVRAQGILESSPARAAEPYRGPSGDGAVERLAPAPLRLVEARPPPSRRWIPVALAVLVAGCAAYGVWSFRDRAARHRSPRGPADCPGEVFQKEGFEGQPLCCPHYAYCD